MKKSMRNLVALLCSFLLVLQMAVPARAAEDQEMYRLYNPNSGEHFYTASQNERNVLSQLGWKYEGAAWTSPSASSKPVYRLYNPNAGDHHYTLDQHEKDVLVSLGWKYEGIGWYSDESQSVPLYRLYNPNAVTGTHHYTASAYEKSQLVKLGWKDEGIGWYGTGTMQESSLPVPSSSGALHVEGTALKDQNGNTVQLQGVSSHGLAWYPQYISNQTIAELKNSWNINVIRLALYTEEYGGYCSGGNQQELMNKVVEGIELARKYDLYVIVDWHILNDGDPNTHLSEAKTFFSQIAQKYKDCPNIIYEICNEPNGSVSWSRIKSYAENLIPVITAQDPDALIIVGTPQWSQKVDSAAADPIRSCSNVLYSLHFYAATHKEDLRSTLVQAVNAGLPVFVSEFGLCDASGNGNYDFDSAAVWLDLLDQYSISYVVWNLSNKNESSALLKTDSLSGWSDSDLTEGGKWIKNRFASTSSSSVSSGTTAEQTSGNTTVSSSGINITPVSSWTSGNRTYTQYSVSFTPDRSVSSWKMSIRFSGAISLEQGWCGSYSVSQNSLTITPADYNSALSAGQTISNTGFIVSTDVGALQVVCVTWQ